jgi:TolB protein
MIKKIVIILALFTNSLYAIDATMEIVKSKSSLPLIEVQVSRSNTDQTLTSDLTKLIKKDLDVSGHFNQTTKTIQKQNESNINYHYLKGQKIDLYLSIDLSINIQSDTLTLLAKLYDINEQTVVYQKQYSVGNKKRYPFLAHGIAIDINNYLKAPKIDWMNKFVIFARYIDSKTSEIVIADYTLTFQKTIVKNGLNIFPKWANKDQLSFYYTTFNYAVPTLMKMDLYTSRKTKVLSSDGMIVCSDVSKDGTKILLTMAPNSQPDIYLYDMNSRLKTRLTRYKGIDVGGSFVENENKIVFISDRLKYPNIFAKTIGQRGIERLVYHGRNNSQCTTYGKYIVYSSRETNSEFGKNIFNLYLISTQSDYIKRLTTTGINQFPKFSTDGESVLFIKNDKKSSLGIIRINHNKSFLFPLKTGKLQSIDW